MRVDDQPLPAIPADAPPMIDPERERAERFLQHFENRKESPVMQRMAAGLRRRLEAHEAGKAVRTP